VYHKLLAIGRNSEHRIEKSQILAKKAEIVAFQKALGLGGHSREM